MSSLSRPVACLTLSASSTQQSSTTGKSGWEHFSQCRKCVDSLSLNGMSSSRTREDNDFKRVSNCFDFVAFYAHRQGALDRIDGNHEGAVSVPLHQHALHTIQRPAADSHPLADLQERMRRPGYLRFDQAADRIDLLVRNGRAFAPGADQPEHSIHSQNL